MTVLLGADPVGGPAADVALGPLLLRRGLGDATDVLRIYSPEPTAAFSRRDTLRPGFAAASAAVRALGFTPVVRPQGGSLAAYHQGSVVVDHVHRAAGEPIDPVERFQRFAALHAGLLTGLGVDARIGPVPGEYCPGEYSINAGGVKIVGSAQRVTRDGWLFSTVLQVAGTARLRAVHTAAYAALGYAFDPATVGTIEDVTRTVSVADVSAAVLAAYRPAGPPVPVPAGLRAGLGG